MTLAVVRQLREQVGELVAKHDQLASAADYTRYADDPVGFMRDVLRCEPWAKQEEMAEAVRDHSRVVVVTANGLGKDWLTARVALWWVYARRGMVILTGPTERQTKNVLMREVRKGFAKAPELPGELFALELRVTDDCGILAFTSDNADKLTGFHHPRLLVCMTEGQGCEPEAYEAAQACCTGEENRLFVYGNPTRPSGPFARAAESDSWHCMTIAATAHPNVITGREEIPGAVSRAWIDSMREEYGESSSFYKSRVLAQFPTESVEGLLKREWVRAAFDRHDSEALVPQSWDYPLWIAVDVARYGPDSTVLAFCRGPVVEKLVTWRGASITDTADRVLAHVEENTREPTPKFPKLGHRPRLVVDEPGLGGGLIDVLRKKGMNVTAFNGANRATDPRRFLNSRAESHWRIRELLENNLVAIPRDAMMEEEALSVEWQLAQSGGTVQILSKDTIRATLGRSPDRLDAVVIGLGHSIGRLGHTASFSTYIA